MSMSNQNRTDSNSSVQDIPEEWQNISLEEIIEADYEVAPQTTEESNEDSRPRGYFGRHTPPGRVPNDGSIDASSEDPRGTDQGYIFTGYDTVAATRIGDETDTESDQINRFRELNEGRHRSDGNHGLRESRRDKDRLIEAICTSLPISSHEQHKVSHVVGKLEFERFGYQKGLVPVILGTVIVVIDERHRDIEDMEDTISWSNEFRQICDAHEISMSDLTTIKEEIRYQVIIHDIRIPSGEKLPKRDPSLPSSTPLNERSEAYWNNIPSEYWTRLAQHWQTAPDDLKSALPDNHRERIEQLRRWKPWEDDGDDGGDDVTQPSSHSDVGEYEEAVGEIEELLKEVEDELEKLDETTIDGRDHQGSD